MRVVWARCRPSAVKHSYNISPLTTISVTRLFLLHAFRLEIRFAARHLEKRWCWEPCPGGRERERERERESGAVSYLLTAVPCARMASCNRVRSSKTAHHNNHTHTCTRTERGPYPEGPCTPISYTFALKCLLYEGTLGPKYLIYGYLDPL